MSDIAVEDVALAPKDEDVRAIAQLAKRQLELTREEERAKEALENIQLALKDVRERALPAAMAQAGISSFALQDGTSIEVAQAVKASIPKTKISEAHQWLEEHGHADLIKRRITIMFGRDQVAWAKKFLADCARRKQPLNLDQKEWVEPQTLMAFVREQRREAAATGADPDTAVPAETFGVYVQNYAKISR